MSALFSRTTPVGVLGAEVPVPDPATTDWFGLLPAGLSFAAMRYGKLGIIPVPAGCAGLGFFWKLLF